MKCIVFGCTNSNYSKKTKNKYRFYRFPNDNELQKQWLLFCERPDNLNIDTARVCDAHFLPDDFERNMRFEMGFTRKNGHQLKPDVVPSVKPNTAAIDQSKNKTLKKTQRHKQTKTMKIMPKWHMWCRLCAKEDALDNVNILLSEEQHMRDSMKELDGQSNSLSLVAFLEKCFSVTFLPNDELPKTMCPECFSLITNMASYAKRVANVQKMLLTLRIANKNVDLHEVRLEYGLTEILKCKQENICEITMPTETAHNDLAKKSNCCLDIKIEKEQILEQEVMESNYTETFIENLQSNIKDEHEETYENERQNEFAIGNAAQSHQNNEDLINENNINEILNITCNKCESIFANQTQYDLHAKTHLPKAVKTAFTCHQCNKNFPKKYILDNHISCVHENEYRFVCHQCGLALKSSSSLKYHIRTHSEAGRFKCKICSKGFHRRLAFEGHMDTHNTDEKFQCSECGKKLNSRHTLRNHMLVHSDVRKFECDYCKRTFKFGRYLKAHLMLHVGLKPYACQFCERTFGSKSVCRTHEKKIHPKDLAASKTTCEQIAPNIPTLKTLKALIKTGNNLVPLSGKRRMHKHLLPLEVNDSDSMSNE